MKKSRTLLGTTFPRLGEPLVLPAVSSDAANLKALLRVLWGKTNWAAGAARTLGCSERHVYRLTGGQRRLTLRAVAILEAVAADRLKRREREIRRDLALAHLRAAEERGQFPWARHYLAELRQRAERRRLDTAAAKLAQQQRRQPQPRPDRGERDPYLRDL
jgi:hypothetical protein